jgi:hypothetical protein
MCVFSGRAVAALKEQEIRALIMEIWTGRGLVGRLGSGTCGGHIKTPHCLVTISTAERGVCN